MVDINEEIPFIVMSKNGAEYGNSYYPRTIENPPYYLKRNPIFEEVDSVIRDLVTDEETHRSAVVSTTVKAYRVYVNSVSGATVETDTGDGSVGNPFKCLNSALILFQNTNWYCLNQCRCSNTAYGEILVSGVVDYEINSRNGYSPPFIIIRGVANPVFSSSMNFDGTKIVYIQGVLFSTDNCTSETLIRVILKTVEIGFHNIVFDGCRFDVKGYQNHTYIFAVAGAYQSTTYNFFKYYQWVFIDCQFVCQSWSVNKNLRFGTDRAKMYGCDIQVAFENQEPIEINAFVLENSIVDIEAPWSCEMSVCCCVDSQISICSVASVIFRWDRNLMSSLSIYYDIYADNVTVTLKSQMSAAIATSGQGVSGGNIKDSHFSVIDDNASSSDSRINLQCSQIEGLYCDVTCNASNIMSYAIFSGISISSNLLESCTFIVNSYLDSRSFSYNGGAACACEFKQDSGINDFLLGNSTVTNNVTIINEPEPGYPPPEYISAPFRGAYDLSVTYENVTASEAPDPSIIYSSSYLNSIKNQFFSLNGSGEYHHDV